MPPSKGFLRKNELHRKVRVGLGDSELESQGFEAQVLGLGLRIWGLGSRV